MLWWVISKWGMVDDFAMLTLFHWFITENLISDLISVAIDILLQIWTNGSKEGFQAFIDILFIILAIYFISIKILLIWIILIRFGNPGSDKFFLFDGLHPSRVKLYFIHLVFYRLGLTLLVVLIDAVSN